MGSLSSIDPILLLASLMVASTPILIAALGELVVERAGVLNLGVEGMMITGAACGLVVAYSTSSPWLGFIGAAIGGMALSFLFALLTQYLLSNQVATGLALALFGLGLSALIGQGYADARPPAFPKLDIPVLSDIPVLGPILFRHDGIVYLGLLLLVAVWYFLNKTRGGLVLRAVGENHEAAHALGYHVVRIRTMAILFGGACAGLAGAYISLVRVPQWTEGMTAGSGWIALAIVVFAGWKPWRLLLGAYLFGGVTVLQLNLQAAGATFPVWITGMVMMLIAGWIVLSRRANGKSLGTKALAFTGGVAVLGLIVFVLNLGNYAPFRIEYLSMSPYVATIIVLVVLSAGRAPGSLGKTFHASR